MSLRLRNQNNPKKTLSLSEEAWSSILDLAEEYGWNPMGTALSEHWYVSETARAGYDLYDVDGWVGNYSTDEGGLVLLDDALNLADALDRAFLEYEPEPPHLFGESSFIVRLCAANRLRPSLGAIAALTDFCRSGAFWIEKPA